MARNSKGSLKGRKEGSECFKFLEKTTKFATRTKSKPPPLTPYLPTPFCPGIWTSISLHFRVLRTIKFPPPFGDDCPLPPPLHSIQFYLSPAASANWPFPQIWICQCQTHLLCPYFPAILTRLIPPSTVSHFAFPIIFCFVYTFNPPNIRPVHFFAKIFAPFEFPLGWKKLKNAMRGKWFEWECQAKRPFSLEKGHPRRIIGWWAKMWEDGPIFFWPYSSFWCIFNIHSAHHFLYYFSWPTSHFNHHSNWTDFWPNRGNLVYSNIFKSKL